jgi:prepilin-type N-terminal cleavage/methylation domain-containing protein
MKLTKIKTKAFTLIELLVVIAIIGILSGFILVTMNGATNSATDAKRKTTISGLAKALMAYQTSNGSTPVNTTLCDLKQDGTGCTGFPATLVPEYMGSIPADPNGTTYYKYYSNGTTFAIRSLLSNNTYYNYSSSNGSFSQGNILILNQSNCCESGTTTNHNQYYSTISAEPTGTTPSWQGNYSLKIVLNNGTTGEGTYGSMVPIKSNTAYTVSVYMKGDVGKIIRVGTEERNSGGTIVASHSADGTLSASWTRTVFTFTTGPTVAYIDLYIRSIIQQACTFYIDGMQIEEGSSATNWIPGN